MTTHKSIVLILQLCLLHFLGVQLVDAVAISDRQTLGQPKVRDCQALYNKLPFAYNQPRGELIAPRLFLEPQYLSAFQLHAKSISSSQHGTTSENMAM